jgi:hypothetical protein
MTGRTTYCSKRCANRAWYERRNEPRFCSECSEPVPKGRREFCSDRCQRRRYRAEHPEYREQIRARCRRWAKDKRGCRRPKPWLRGAPAYVGRLPGGTCLLDLQPDPRWPIELRNARALHGVLTVLLGKDHVDHRPAWALRPSAESPCGWAVHWIDPDALALAGSVHEVSIFNEQRALYLSDPSPVASPVVTRRGRRRLQVDTITPVCSTTTGRAVARLEPTAQQIRSALRMLPPRIGLSVADDDLQLELVERQYEAERVDCGGKYGAVRGWVGRLVVETNATGEWLLRVAATLGLGGRVAFGFGAIAVKEVER